MFSCRGLHVSTALMARTSFSEHQQVASIPRKLGCAPKHCHRISVAHAFKHYREQIFPTPANTQNPKRRDAIHRARFFLIGTSFHFHMAHSRGFRVDTATEFFVRAWKSGIITQVTYPAVLLAAGPFDSHDDFWRLLRLMPGAKKIAAILPLCNAAAQDAMDVSFLTMRDSMRLDPTVPVRP